MTKKLTWITLFALTLVFGLSVAAWAADAPKIDTGDTAFILVSAALVLLMTPGLALFYGGLARKKNVLNTMMMSFVILGIITVQWVLIGYALSFGKNGGAFIGSLEWIGMSGIGIEPDNFYGTTIPHNLFMVYQMMFALITVALISGAIAGRMRFGAYVLFALLWSTLVYDPLAHWVWGKDGWLAVYGAVDFAGGTVVHISSGVSALVACIMLGKRKGHGAELMLPHNLPMVVLGASLLWFGWFGFNAGSAWAANGLAANAFVTTQIATGAAILSWVLVEWIRHGKPTVLGAASGCIAGLVAITPACGFVGPMAALIIGLLVSPLCYFMVSVVKAKLGYDDALDAFGIHGVGGTFGALATGLFSESAINSLAKDGLFISGDPTQLIKQLVATIVAWVLAAVATFVILKIVAAITPLRVSEAEEETGLDFTQHGEEGYSESLAGDSVILKSKMSM